MQRDKEKPAGRGPISRPRYFDFGPELGAGHAAAFVYRVTRQVNGLACRRQFDGGDNAGRR